jgi:Protein of Unknown function (DUF2604)
MPDAKPEKKISLTVVVSGQPVPIEINHNRPVEHLVEKALKESGNHGQAPDQWELRTESGDLIDQSLQVDQAGIHDGITLFLNPKTGAGG